MNRIPAILAAACIAAGATPVFAAPGIEACGLAVEEESLTVPQPTADAPSGGAANASSASGEASDSEAGAGRGGDGTPPDFGRIEEVVCAGGALPEGQSAITAKVQALLDRAGVSPGVIDGWRGGMTESAIRAFEAREGLAADGVMDSAVWEALAGVRDAPVTQSYTVTADDVDVVGPIPADYSEQAGYARLGFERATEKIAERFHMDEDFLRALNPGADFAPGETVTVMAPGEPIAAPEREGEALVPRVRVDKASGRLYALDGAGGVVASYPVTIGSQSTPSPSGTHEVLAIAWDPVYYYDPDTFVQGDNLEPLELPPGPNNPVGLVWIDLSEEGYGIHGTPSPSKLYTLASHGCVRMTNWDAIELASMVGEGTVVEFTE